MLKNALAIAALASSALAPSFAAEPVSRTPVEDFRELLVTAIAASAGTAHGVLVGPMAQAITDNSGAKGPLLLDVSTLRRYQQPGCARLNVRISQEGVQAPAAKSPGRQTIDIGIDYCRDGSAPKSLS
jgi:hypothetical protein